MNRIDLRKYFEKAIKNKHKFMGVLINVEGKKEVIIFESDRFEEKLSYYMTAYNENLTLKNNENIKIIDLFSGISCSLVSRLIL